MKKLVLVLALAVAAMLTHIHHSATLRKTADGGKVVAFEPKYLDMGEIRRH